MSLFCLSSGSLLSPKENSRISRLFLINQISGIVKFDASSFVDGCGRRFINCCFYTFFLLNLLLGLAYTRTHSLDFKVFCFGYRSFSSVCTGENLTRFQINTELPGYSGLVHAGIFENRNSFSSVDL